MAGDDRGDVWQRLTPRQREVCRVLVQGCSNAEIAAKLGISVSTVQNHLHSILRKLGVRRRGEVMADFWRDVSRIGAESQA